METGIVSAKNNELVYNVFQNDMTGLRNFSVLWLFVATNYSL